MLNVSYELIGHQVSICPDSFAWVIWNSQKRCQIYWGIFIWLLTRFNFILNEINSISQKMNEIKAMTTATTVSVLVTSAPLYWFRQQKSQYHSTKKRPANRFSFQFFFVMGERNQTKQRDDNSNKSKISNA